LDDAEIARDNMIANSPRRFSMTMNKWKDLFEMIALVAVVGSLVAVVVELQQTQTSMRAQAYQARAFDGIAWNMELARDPSINRLQTLLDSGEFDAASLSEEERQAIGRLITIVRIDLDNEHFQYQSGLLDPGFYHGETVLRIQESAPIWRDLGILSPRPAFKEEVDRILADVTSETPAL
jgi:hypothetical protein